MEGYFLSLSLVAVTKFHRSTWRSIYDAQMDSQDQINVQTQNGALIKVPLKSYSMIAYSGRRAYFSVSTASKQNSQPCFVCSAYISSRYCERPAGTSEILSKQLLSFGGGKVNYICLNLTSSIETGHREVAFTTICQLHVNSL